MAAAVATPLEKQFSTIAGIDNMTSTSVLGSTSITIQFNLDREHQRGGTGRRSRDPASARQSADWDHPAVVLPPEPRGGAGTVQLALTSKTEPLSVLDEIGETTIAQRISMVDGVSQVQVSGQQKYAVRIALNPQALGVARDRRRPGDRGGQRAERQPADRHHVGHGPGHHRTGDGQFVQRRPVRQRSSSPTTILRRSCCATSPPSPTTSRTIGRPPGSTTSGRSCWPSCASRARTRSK